MSKKLQSSFNTSWNEMFPLSNIGPLFASISTSDNILVTKDESSKFVFHKKLSLEPIESKKDLHSYQEVELLEVRKVVKQMALEFDINIVLFDDVIRLLIALFRVISSPQGSLLLLGAGALGRHTLTKLACLLAGIKVSELGLGNYTLSDWRSDMKSNLMKAGRGESVLLLISDANMNSDYMWDDINTILTSGEIPNLFEPDEIDWCLEELKPKALLSNVPESMGIIFNFMLLLIQMHYTLILLIMYV